MASTSLCTWATVITEGPTRAATEPLPIDVVVDDSDQTAGAATQAANRIRPEAQVVGRNRRGWRGRRTLSLPRRAAALGADRAPRTIDCADHGARLVRPMGTGCATAIWLVWPVFNRPLVLLWDTRHCRVAGFEPSF